MAETNESLVDLGDKVKGQIELPTLDITPYIGKTTKIDKVEEHKGNFGYYVKFLSEIVDTIGEGDNKIELRATKIVGLHEDVEGNLGWNDETKMGLLLKKFGVTHYKDIQGKEVICQTTTGKEGKEFLTF